MTKVLVYTLLPVSTNPLALQPYCQLESRFVKSRSSYCYCITMFEMFVILYTNLFTCYY